LIFERFTALPAGGPIPPKRMAIWSAEPCAQKTDEFPVPAMAALIGGLMAIPKRVEFSEMRN
jgi:hypothetical protein